MLDVAATLLLGLAHHRAGRVDEAACAYRSVLADDPAQPNALALYGHLLAGSDDRAAAALLERAAAARPDDAEARLALGNIAQRAGDAAAAARWWRAALVCAPAHEGAAVNLAGATRASGAWRDAADIVRGALALSPLSVPLWVALGECLLAGGAFQAAVMAADAALALDGRNPSAWLTRGTALAGAGDPGAALDALRSAVALAPGDARPLLHLGNVLFDLDRLEEAELHLARAVALAPDLPEAQTSLGALHAARRRFDAALACHDRALALRPDFAEAHGNRAAALLLAGDYQQGFAEYEWRKRDRRGAGGCWRGDGPEWTGQDLRGRTLLVFGEQGFGDSLMCARYLAPLDRGGAKIVLVAPAPLLPLLGGLPGIVAAVPCAPPGSAQLLAPGTPLPPHDFWVNQLSLPLLFGTTPDRMESRDGYLHAPDAAIAAWGGRLPPGRKMGLVWAGNPAHRNDRRRSIAPDLLAPLLCVPGVAWVSLQRDGPVPDGVLDAGPALADFALSAGLLAHLSGVVCVDTAVAHLAGALGVAAAVLLPYAPDWRWLAGRDDTPWYASMRLFRQEIPGDWSVPIGRVAAAVADWPGTSSG
jgi:tetratricopeptide (TPR) repeat protein